MLSEQIQLLDFQLKLKQLNEAVVKKKTNMILMKEPPVKAITSESLLSTVYHCEYYHPKIMSNSAASSSANAQGRPMIYAKNELYLHLFTGCQMMFRRGCGLCNIQNSFQNDRHGVPVACSESSRQETSMVQH